MEHKKHKHRKVHKRGNESTTCYHLGISNLKWTGIGHFPSEDHRVYSGHEK